MSAVPTDRNVHYKVAITSQPNRGHKFATLLKSKRVFESSGHFHLTVEALKWDYHVLNTWLLNCGFIFTLLSYILIYYKSFMLKCITLSASFISVVVSLVVNVLILLYYEYSFFIYKYVGKYCKRYYCKVSGILR